MSPAVAAISALTGLLTSPEGLADVKIEVPTSFKINDNMIEMPLSEEEAVDAVVERGPNIKPIPELSLKEQFYRQY